MTAETINALLGIAATAIPEVAALIKAISAFKKKYPGIGEADLVLLLTSITGANDAAADALVAKIAADQAAHPTV